MFSGRGRWWTLVDGGAERYGGAMSHGVVSSGEGLLCYRFQSCGASFWVLGLRAVRTAN